MLNIFHTCNNLTSVKIGNSVTSIGDGVFASCPSLTSVLIPNSVTSIGRAAFDNCSGLTSVQIGNNVMSIGDDAFSVCSSLRSITIPNSVIDIGRYAFEDCRSLTTITIGNGVKNIYYRAFANCSELTDVYCYANNVPSTNSEAFSDSYIEYTTLHVPLSSINSYSTTEPWKKFKEIVKINLPKHILSYILDGETYKIYEIEEGETITPEPTPTKEGYTFNGWSEIPETMPAHDVTVTGTFTINKYKLTYTVDGEEYKTYEVEYGATITPEAAPTKEGYTFSGWSEIPETMPAHDVTVTGSFTINSYKLTYMIDDKMYKEMIYEYGVTINPEPQPEGDYTTFEWTDIPQTMPAHDVVVYASYATGIIELLIATQNNICIYSPNGKKLNKLQKGLNILVLDDGTVKKVVVK